MCRNRVCAGQSAVYIDPSTPAQNALEPVNRLMACFNFAFTLNTNIPLKSLSSEANYNFIFMLFSSLLIGIMRLYNISEFELKFLALLEILSVCLCVYLYMCVYVNFNFN